MKVPVAFIVLVGLRLSSEGGAPPDSYKDAVLADKPFAYYRLGEAASTDPVADEAGKNAGVYVNDPKVGVPGAIATDPKNAAVSFAREREQYIKLTNLGNFGSSLSSGFSVEFWLKTSEFSDHQTIFDSNSPESWTTALTCDIATDRKAKQLRLYCRDDHLNRFEAGFYPGGKNVDIYDDGWHHIVYVYDPNAHALIDQVLLYVDGARQQMTVGHKNASPTLSDFKQPVTLGASDPRGSVRNNLEGSLDEFAFYLSPLSETQITNHYRAAGQRGEGQTKKQVRVPFGFPVLPPVAGADPAIRHKEVIQFPTKLLFDRKEGTLMVGVDKDGTKPVEIAVGSGMIVGTRDHLIVYPADQARPAKQSGSWGYTGGTDLTHSKTSVNFLLKENGDLVPGKQYIVELDVEVFETDIPPQHMWMPEGHKFKVLFTDRLKQTVTPVP